LVSFFDKTLRIRLELGARTMFTLPFLPVIAFIKEVRSKKNDLHESVKQEITVRGHYANLQNDIGMTQGDITVAYTYYSEEHTEALAFSAPGCGKIQVNFKRLIPFMDYKMQRAIGQDDEPVI